MTLLQHGVGRSVIALWLGHESTWVGIQSLPVLTAMSLFFQKPTIRWSGRRYQQKAFHTRFPPLVLTV